MFPQRFLKNQVAIKAVLVPFISFNSPKGIVFMLKCRKDESDAAWAIFIKNFTGFRKDLNAPGFCVKTIVYRIWSRIVKIEIWLSAVSVVMNVFKAKLTNPTFCLLKFPPIHEIKMSNQRHIQKSILIFIMADTIVIAISEKHGA